MVAGVAAVAVPVAAVPAVAVPAADARVALGARAQAHAAERRGTRREAGCASRVRDQARSDTASIAANSS